MHHLYYAIVSKDEAKNSEEARLEAQSTLDANNFSGEGGYFGGSKADWYVVGGRWSGHLQEIRLGKVGKDFYKAVKETICEGREYISHTEVDSNKEKLQKIWEDMGGEGINPYGRSSYNNEGYPDDAEIITEELLSILKEKDRGVECFDSEDFEEYQVEDISSDKIGDWIVVIDYHD